MLCENCGKKNATSIYMPPNETNLKYLCGECYKKLNNDTDLENFAYMQAQQVEIDAECKLCGTKFSDFENSGLFGCENCYKAFNEYITKKNLPNFKEQKY